MSKIFNWEYFSFVTLDDAVAYKVILENLHRLYQPDDLKMIVTSCLMVMTDDIYKQEVLVVPAVIFVLSMVWMQLVKGHGEEEVRKEQTERKINFEQAYQVYLVVFCVDCSNHDQGCRHERGGQWHGVGQSGRGGRGGSSQDEQRRRGQER